MFEVNNIILWFLFASGQGYTEATSWRGQKIQGHREASPKELIIGFSFKISSSQLENLRLLKFEDVFACFYDPNQKKKR